ncbi:hypothetical protein MJO29_003183 [Puccinia striiformis f. sp. tritici]|nr:hypothetical protein MJO29_003183 [Puccinia striiformis f. sp. tritici]
MDHSQDAWGTPNDGSDPSPASQMGRIPKTNSPNQSSVHEGTITKLMKEVVSLKASWSKSDRKKATKLNPKLVAPASRPAPKKAPVPTDRSSNPTRVSVSASKKKGPVPPKKTVATKPITPKRHPKQMQKDDFPPGFTPTKTALFTHIKILWGLEKQGSVPRPPELSTLEEFYRRFQRPEQIEEAIKKPRTHFGVQSNLQFLLNVQGGRVKYGKSVVHLGSNFVRYAQGLMNQLGLEVWCPNLDEDSTSLYNLAHRISALTTFTELASTIAYAYLGINPRMAGDLTLLIPAYDHFVHYLQYENYRKELKEEGKRIYCLVNNNVAKDAAHKRFSKNRERLRDERLDYAIVNKFPKQYRAILEQISAHSDDKKEEGNRFFTIKTLPFRSRNANRFFRRLDTVMLKSAEQNFSAQGSRRRIRRLPRTPVMLTSLVAPKGLAIDYYGPKWYNELDLAQQKKIPNRSILAFLPNASESLHPKDKRHPDEKLLTRAFTKKYWEVLAEPYGLVLGDSSDSDDDDQDGEGGNGGGSDKEGEGIDLTVPSSDDSGDEFYEEGDAGSLYEDEDEGEVFVDDEEEDDAGGDNEEEEDEEDEESYEDKVLDEDCKMADIPEGKEEW